MTKKSLLLTLILITLLVTAGIFWCIEKRQVAVNQPTINPVVEVPAQVDPEKDFSPQHIVAIPGSKQVWYEIPEMGIKLLLSKETAEELVYRYSPKRDSDIFVEVNGVEANLITVKDVEGVNFSARHILEYNKTCIRSGCGTDESIFSFVKIPGKYTNEEFAFGLKFLKQFLNFYLVIGAPPQAVPFATREEEEWFTQNIGPKMPGIPPLKDIYIEPLEGK